MMRRESWGGLGLALALAGCGTTTPEPQIRTVEIKVPVARTCVPENLPPPPVYRVTPADILAAPEGPARVVLAGVALAERIARLNEVEPVVAKCR